MIPADAATRRAVRPVVCYPVEILLQTNPAALKVGDTLSFKTLRKGQPMTGQLVYASYEGFHGHSPDGGHINAVRLRTDAEGMGSFKITPLHTL